MIVQLVRQFYENITATYLSNHAYDTAAECEWQQWLSIPSLRQWSELFLLSQFNITRLQTFKKLATLQSSSIEVNMMIDIALYYAVFGCLWGEYPTLQSVFPLQSSTLTNAA